MSYSIIAYVTGLLFLTTGLIKATHPKKFIRHIDKLGLFSKKSGPLVALILTEFECAIGFALIAGFLLADLIPVLLFFLLLATSISWWGIHKGKILDCGCYGGVFWISPKVSWLINGISTISLYLYWIELEGPRTVVQWKIWGVTGVLIFVNILFKISLKRSLINLSPIKQGNRWRSKWLQTDQKIEEFEKILIVFLNQRCPECLAWISYLEQIKDLEIVAISPQGGSKPLQIPSTVGSINEIKAWKFNYLADSQPQGVLLEKGKIVKIWTGKFPAELLGLTASTEN